MALHVDTASRLPIYQQLAQQIREAIARGELEPAVGLPSVRQLSRELVINPNTVARAYRELEQAGVVVKRSTAGTFVSDAGSPLARRERLKILTERIDALLAEAHQMNIDVDEVIALLRQRDETLHIHTCLLYTSPSPRD